MKGVPFGVGWGWGWGWGGDTLRCWGTRRCYSCVGFNQLVRLRSLTTFWLRTAAKISVCYITQATQGDTMALYSLSSYEVCFYEYDDGMAITVKEFHG